MGDALASMTAEESNHNGQAVTNGVSTAAGERFEKPFELLQQWHSQLRKLRIIHVGAGATGLCAAFKLERQLTDYELVCYDKNHEVGGTWLQNRYPGCACDVPAHIYTYTFEPNPDWKSYYAYSPQIQDYFTGFCDKYGLRKYIKLQHKVLGAVWHEDKAQWAVEIEHAGTTFTDWCDILMNGSGLLNQYKCESNMSWQENHFDQGS
jgi:cation diffusion facilitator CzcD-associated flavoprotein CzcO